MDLDKELTSILHKAIEQLGIEPTRKIIDKCFQKYQSSQSQHHKKCAQCKEDLAQDSDSYETPSTQICLQCKTKNFSFAGNCRTLRQSGNCGYRKISLRYLSNNNEELFEFYDLENCSLEMKSKDRFSISFTEPNERCYAKILIANLTTRRNFEFPRVRIYDFKLQFPHI